MDFAEASDIVDRLTDALTAKRHMGGMYIAMEWVGAETREEIMRALYLSVAERYRATFPMSRSTGALARDFDEYTQAAGGCARCVATQIFPMSDLAPLAKSDRSSPVYWDAEKRLSEQSMANLQAWVSCEDFAVWLKSVDPTFSDYLPMVNDRINRLLPAERA